MPDRVRRSLAWLPIVLITLAAFGMRIWALDIVPPGITHDEAAHLQDAQRIWEGYRPVYLTTAYGREPLYDYATAPLVGLLGMTVTTGRLASALWGTTLVAILFAWVRHAFDRPTASLTAALVAVSFWPVATSREILRSVTMPVLLVGAMVCFWRGVYPPDNRHRLRPFIFAGLLLGLGWYSYMPARIMWLVPALFGLVLALTDRPRWRRTRRGLALMVAVMVVIALPLVVYLAQHPELEVRVTELAAPLRSLQEGDAAPLWSRLKETALMFSNRGDVQWIYNIAGRPLLPPLLAVLFYVGIGIAIGHTIRDRHPAYLVLLLWLALGAAPALVTGLESSSLRAIAAQPAVFVVVALPLVALGRALLGSGAKQSARAAAAIAVALLFTWLAASTVVSYFDEWANNRDTRVAYHTHLTEMVKYVAGSSVQLPTSISTIYPGTLHDPYAADAIAGIRGIGESIRWYDGRSALVFPDAEEAVAVFPALAPLDPALGTLFEPAAHLVERVDLRPDDLSPWFEVYRWAPSRARSALSLDYSLNVGDVLTLVGFELGSPEIEPGDAVDLVTFWIPSSRPALGFELVLFTHLTRDGVVVAQRDQLDVPPSSWRAGELFAQLHRLQVPGNAPEGVYTLECGAYLPDRPYEPLPISKGGRRFVNAAVLDSVLVK